MTPTPDPALAARLDAMLEPALQYDSAQDELHGALDTALRSGQLITLADHERAVQAAVAKAVEAERAEDAAWHPIETAPKDGTMLLVCLPRMMKLIIRARFNVTHNYWMTDYEGEGGITKPHFFHHGDLWKPMPDTSALAQIGAKP